MRILLIRLSALGDVVGGLFALSAVRARRPAAEIGWLVEDRFAPLLEGHPDLARVHVYPRARLRGALLRPWRLARLLALGRELRRERYDLALDLQGNLKSGALARLAGARDSYGFAPPLSREGNRWFLRRNLPPPRGHRVDALCALVTAALGAGPSPPATLPSRAEPHGAVVLHPGTSRFGAFKRWPAASFAALGDRLADRLSAPVWLTAGPGEEDQAREVADAMSGPARIVQPPGLRDLVDTLAGARLVVAGDTGPAHVAAALKTPTLALFGPKDPAEVGPRGPRARSLRLGVRCSPCALRFCPDPVCMTDLSVDTVEAAALDLLSEGAR